MKDPVDAMFHAIIPDSPAYASKRTISEDDPEVVTSAVFDFVAPMRSEVISHSGAIAITEELSDELSKHGLTGYRISPTHARIADWIDGLAPIRELPPLDLLVVHGKAMKDDFGLNEAGKLVISDGAYAVLVSRDPGIEEFRYDVDMDGRVLFLKRLGY